jgi:hypothetical protein
LKPPLQPMVRLKSKDSMSVVLKSMKELARREVLVGVPESKAGRKEGTINNARLAYIHDNGSPLAGIPPREFLRPGIKDDQEELARRLGQAGRASLNGDADGVTRALHATGLEAQKAIRHKITVGPFTPLKASTVRARARKHKGRKGTSTTPLVDTGQLRNAINYVVNEK